MSFGQAFSGMFTSLNWAGWIHAFILLIMGGILASLLSRALVRVGGRLSRHQQVMLRRLVFYVVLLLFVIAALREAGFELSVLLGAAGILTVAIGFASQTSASNMISGLFLLAEKPFEIGNFIEVDSTRGEVVSIDLMSVKLRTVDNLYVRIPNETLIKSKVTNLTRFPLRRVDLQIGIAYRESIAQVKQLLLAMAEDDPRCLEEPRPFVLVLGLGASSVDLQFSFWVRTEDVRDMRSDMLQAVKDRLDREGIEIPFPHTSVYAGSASEPFRIQLVSPANQQDRANDDNTTI
ncbi:mechanosensitive ion channel family protein [Mangrovitalea sediminis]|uniref:mechanosensitive ion channel family protein n=1 Tax=Mangrovitalea sediminis TaxID=1982043 RepID=UPI0018EA1149|nr:mechanosensitive ion channel family protein [Mangrovitalea sediminis]